MLFESAQQWWPEYLSNPGGLAGRAIGQLRAGSEVSTSDYEKALKLAGEIRAEVDATFETVDGPAARELARRRQSAHR